MYGDDPVGVDRISVGRMERDDLSRMEPREWRWLHPKQGSHRRCGSHRGRFDDEPTTTGRYPEQHEAGKAEAGYRARDQQRGSDSTMDACAARTFHYMAHIKKLEAVDVGVSAAAQVNALRHGEEPTAIEIVTGA